MQVVQFYPDRIVTTSVKEPEPVLNLDRIASGMAKNRRLRHLVSDYPFEKRMANLRKKKSSATLSKTSKRQIRDSISSLVMLSKPRTIQTAQKKFIYNYRASFITLSLPSVQVHTDVEIKECINLLMNNLRSIFQIKNYVWKAELQKNKNIHFHLVLDQYISYHNLLHYWNKAINSLGYVDRYQDKFSQMSFKEYAAARSEQDLIYGNEISMDKYRNSYIAGKSSGWRRPNSVSVNNVRTDGQVAYYLAKYLGKQADESLDPDRFEKFGKVWSRSRSLSGLKYRNKFELPEIKDWLKNLLTECADATVQRYYDYCNIIYINFKKLKRNYVEFIRKIIYNNSKLYAYPHPT